MAYTANTKCGQQQRNWLKCHKPKIIKAYPKEHHAVRLVRSPERTHTHNSAGVKLSLNNLKSLVGKEFLLAGWKILKNSSLTCWSKSCRFTWPGWHSGW